MQTLKQRRSSSQINWSRVVAHLPNVGLMLVALAQMAQLWRAGQPEAILMVLPILIILYW